MTEEIDHGYIQEFLDTISDHDGADVKSRELYIHGAFSKYSGSKWHSLPVILPLLPYRKRFVDVFGGSGIITLNRRRSPIDIFNDRHGGVVAFFRCLRDQKLRDQLVERIKLTLYSREDFINFKENFYKLKDDDLLDRAHQWYCMVQMSYGGLARTWQRATCSSDVTSLYRVLPQLHMLSLRLGKTCIENLDWRTCLKDYDSEDTVFYLDPPYVDSNVYKLKMSRADHYELCETIHGLKGFAALSGFDNPIYQQFEWSEIHSWKIRGDSKEIWNRTEHLWIKHA